MTHLEFLRSSPIARLLERAATGAGVPLSIHYVQRNQEGTRVCGWGQCVACRTVGEMPGGSSACRLSRTTASVMALRQQRPISYLCHLGFACVAVAPFPDEGYVITLGPYCPMEEQRSLADDVLAGFGALCDEAVAVLPCSLDDIHRTPSASVPAVADWLLESLRASWEETQQPGDDFPEELEDSTRVAVRQATGGAAPDKMTGLARELAAALTAGSHARARALLQGHLEEMGRATSAKRVQRHARIGVLVAAAIEALSHTGVSVTSAWPAHAEFVSRLPACDGDKDVLDAAIGVFSFMRRKEERSARAAHLPHYPELYAIVKERLLDGLTLEFVAAELKETPSAISHRLKRKFGMSFSEYVGRIRIDMAKQFIRRTRLSATEVARRVGIADQSNFAKLFKKIEGISPSAYRKAHGKE
ncbi:MAG: helix-turn-helix domain-containing protein [Candidatus Hydrogenedentes bacterium]|nr:helix-turn-helix domain-containing protein [Candidatus Hydrogenedentota bacterium]